MLLRLIASAFFIAVNWLGFAWAVNHHHVLEVSLAYFIGPLLNVMLGIFVLSEGLNRTQWVAVAFAAAECRLSDVRRRSGAVDRAHGRLVVRAVWAHPQRP